MDCNLGSPDKRPCFYKIIWLDNLIHVKIPPDFKEHLTNAHTNRVTLRIGARNWDAKLLQDEEGDMYLSKGWKEFVEYHSLGKAEVLVFKYNGDMSFDVVVYDRNGLARNYASFGTSHQTLPFGSSFPFFKIEIRGFHVGTKCFLPIPLEFSRKHLSMSRQMMILQNSEKISWQVSIIPNRNNRLAICGGWKAFSDSNSIKRGDVCIFELVEKDVMQVHIFK